MLSGLAQANCPTGAEPLPGSLLESPMHMRVQPYLTWVSLTLMQTGQEFRASEFANHLKDGRPGPTCPIDPLPTRYFPSVLI